MPQRTVLLVEDEPLLAMDVETALSKAGFRVIGQAATTADALAIVRTENPDLTILDLNLGDEMAFPVLDFLAASGRAFVILSGHSRHVVPVPHRNRPYLQKPYQEKSLLRLIDEALDGTDRRAGSNAKRRDGPASHRWKQE